MSMNHAMLAEALCFALSGASGDRAQSGDNPVWRIEAAMICFASHHGFEEESAAMSDLPLCLKRAGKEVLLALGAQNDVEERYHRALANRLTAEVVRNLERAPDQIHDWSQLTSAG
jgi:hypothetical protein